MHPNPTAFDVFALIGPESFTVSATLDLDKPETIAGWKKFERAIQVTCELKDKGLQLPRPERKHAHYYKDVSHLQDVDVYRVLTLFGVTDPCLAHAIKKLLVAGGRGAGKDIEQDVREAIDSCNRYIQMRTEDRYSRTVMERQESDQ